MLTEMLKLLYFLLPAYFADMAPVFFKQTLSSLDRPMDYGLKFGGKDLLGRHKTVRGALVAIIAGMIVFHLQQVLDINSIIRYSDYSIFLGFLITFGAVFGDISKSFIKRRFGIAPGKSFIPADQIDAVVGAIIFSAFMIDYTLFQMTFMILATLILKIITNHAGYYLKIREEKW